MESLFTPDDLREVDDALEEAIARMLENGQTVMERERNSLANAWSAQKRCMQALLRDPSPPWVPAMQACIDAAIAKQLNNHVVHKSESIRNNEVWNLKYQLGPTSPIVIDPSNPQSTKTALGGAKVILEQRAGWSVWIEHHKTGARIFDSTGCVPTDPVK